MNQKKHGFRLNFWQISCYAFYSFRSFITEYQMIFFMIFIAGIFKFPILKLLFTFFLGLFVYFFCKFYISSQNFEKNTNFQRKTSIFSQIRNTIFGKSRFKTSKITEITTNSMPNLAKTTQNSEKPMKFTQSLIKDCSFFHKAAKNSQKKPLNLSQNFLVNFYHKIRIFFQKSLNPHKYRNNVSHIYLKKIVKNSNKDEKIPKKPGNFPLIPQGSSSQIFHISKSKPTISSQKEAFSIEIPPLRKRPSLTSKSGIFRTISSSKTVVSFDIPSFSHRQSQYLQFSKKKGHFSRSLSAKRLKERQIPNFLIENYNFLKNDAEKNFEKLGISNEIGDFTDKCRNWVIEEMVYKVFKRNIENIIDINKILESNYRKTVKEFEILYEHRKGENTDKNFEYVSIEDLFNWKENQAFWKVFSTDSKEEIMRIQRDLVNLIEDRKNLDVELGVQGYEISQIR